MADIDITITIPDAWVTRVQESLTGNAEKNINIDCENAHINYSYDPKGSDNWLVYAEKVFIKHLVSQVRLYELSKANEDYRNAINAIEQPTENVPDDLLE